MLRARAELMVINHTQRHHDLEVPAAFWADAVEIELNRNWEIGDFSAWAKGKVLYEIFGVRFLRSDLKRMLPGAKMDEAQPVAVAQREAGGRPMSALWPDWVAELVSYVHESGIPDGIGSAGADDLVAKVAGRLADRGLDAPARTTVLATAKAVLWRMRDDRN